MMMTGKKMKMPKSVPALQAIDQEKGVKGGRSLTLTKTNLLENRRSVKIIQLYTLQRKSFLKIGDL